MQKAKVFISCGQGFDEEKERGLIAQNIFQQEGFEVFYALEQHDSEVLLTKLFQELKFSDYFVCINCKRADTGVGVGSLFVQQEFAIAALLKIPMRVYYFGDELEDWVKKGMIPETMANGELLNTNNELKTKLTNLAKNWNKNSKNQFGLFIKAESTNNTFKPTDFYHLQVTNLSERIHAKNCYSYIESIKYIGGTPLTFKYKLELHWAGTEDEKKVLDIPLESQRDIDAFKVEKAIGQLIFFTYTTSRSPKYRYPSLQQGKYEIIYVVISDNFPTAKLKVQIEVKRNWDVVLLSQEMV